jgi:hypothetical protein
MRADRALGSVPWMGMVLVVSSGADGTQGIRPLERVSPYSVRPETFEHNLGGVPIPPTWRVSGAQAGCYPPAGANDSKSIERDKSAGGIMYGGGMPVVVPASAFVRLFF